jgi:hypothetical protein
MKLHENNDSTDLEFHDSEYENDDWSDDWPNLILKCAIIAFAVFVIIGVALIKHFLF